MDSADKIRGYWFGYGWDSIGGDFSFVFCFVFFWEDECFCPVSPLAPKFFGFYEFPGGAEKFLMETSGLVGECF